MSKIQVLPDEVINRIAAGEVVERPASVVKELVENALDAGADRIRIELEEGGRKRITVTDDGCGMTAADAILSLRRHATSKIASAEDLFNIGTMGFRGEALASIASVGRLALTTKQASAQGVRLTTDGGEKIRETPANAAEGTTITLSELFFNFPAREKFLKSASTEYSHCHELIQAMALCNPHVGFTLIHNGREQLAAEPLALQDEPPFRGEELIRRRTAKVLGAQTLNELLYLRRASEYGSVEALVSPPGVEKASARHMFHFVNGRWVKDKTLRYGILRGYHSHLLKGRYPVVVSYMTLDPSLVDVNVHPAKTELRFQYPSEVQNLLAFAIRDKLRDGEWARSPAAAVTASFFNRDGTSPSAPAADFDLNTLKSPSAAAPRRTATNADSFLGGGPAIKRTVTSFDGVAPSHGDAVETGAPMLFDLEGETQTEAIPWDQLVHLGTFARCYLLFQSDDKLLVVDQHAFHERVLFERLCRDETLLGQSQPLLVPHGVELAPTENAVLRERQSELEKRGFGLAFLSETTVEVKALPAILSDCDVDALLVSLAASNLDGDPSESNMELARHILATVACHGAVRAGEELSESELQQLLKEAREVDFYLNCPHGRRVFKWWTLKEVEGWFNRT